MQFDYFYGSQAEQFSFYRIPKVLFTDPQFKPLSTDAKVLYGILLDRMSLSVKNEWFDKKGRRSATPWAAVLPPPRPCASSTI